MPKAIVRVFTAARMLAIEAQAVVGASVVGDFLTLSRNDGQTIGPFNVRGPKGDTGDINPLNAWPVGSVYTSVSDFINPGLLFGGTWEVIASGRTLVGFSSGETEFNAAEKIGGAKTVKLTAAQSGLPAHTHGITQTPHSHSNGDGNAGNLTSAAGSTYGVQYSTSYTSAENANITINSSLARNASEPHNNLQPYFTVYFWKRTA